MSGKDNLTGGQVQQVLDMLIQQSIFPIIHKSHIFNEQASYLLYQVTTNKKRKISALPADEVISLLCQYLETGDTEKKCAILSLAKIDRGFIYNFVVEMLADLKLSIPIYQEYLTSNDPTLRNKLLKKLKVISKSTGIPVEDMYPVYHQSLGFLQLMYTFRNSIVMQYEKLAHTVAKKICNGSNTYAYQDLVNNLMVSVVKAIDKYDCSKGALTTYIKWWLMNARTAPSNHGHEYGIAYSIPALHRKDMAISPNTVSSNYGISLTSLLKEGDLDFLSQDLGLEQQLERDQENDIFLKLAKRADPTGIARLYLGIDEYFFPEELEKMRNSMNEKL